MSVWDFCFWYFPRFVEIINSFFCLHFIQMIIKNRKSQMHLRQKRITCLVGQAYLIFVNKSIKLFNKLMINPIKIEPCIEHKTRMTN